MMKIGELNTKSGTFEIKYDEKDAYNPYKVYSKWYNGGYHRKLLAKYANLFSCTDAINEYVRRHDETSRRTHA